MRDVPNLITFVRLALVPLLAYLLHEDRYAEALGVFVAAAVSDAADGVIARRFGAQSQLGAWLDPTADKLTMLVAVVGLVWQDLIPLWLAVAMIGRDVVIAGGTIAYRFLFGHVEMAPLALSKLNTGLQFATLALVLAHAAGWVDAGGWLRPLFYLVLATVLLSGAQYVWLWSRKAIASRGRIRSAG